MNIEKKKSTKKKLSSSYAVEKHDRNERIAPLLVEKTRRSSLSPKEENDYEEEDVKEKPAKETKPLEEGCCFAGEEEDEDSSLTENGETTACDAKEAAERGARSRY